MHEAKNRLTELVAAAERGERVIITRHGKPAAEIVGYRTGGGIDWDAGARARKQLGARGSLVKYIAPDFDNPIDPEDFLEGKV